MKKVLSLVLALAMVLAIAVPAFATDEPKYQTEITTGSVNLPAITVIIPANTTIVLNPYKLSYDHDNDPDTAALTDQIIGDDMFVINASESDLKGEVTVTGAVDNANKDVVFATKTLEGDTRTVTKSIFMELQVGKATVDPAKITYEGAKPAVPGDSEDPSDEGTPAEDAKAEAADDAATASYTDATKVTVGTKAAKANFTLGKADPTATTPVYTGVALKLTGNAVSNPTKAWTESDTVTITLVYNFEPTVIVTTTP